MKRVFSILLVTILSFSFIIPTLAVNDEAANAADTLHSLGLFGGTGTDANGNPIYDLERAPTRSEAVTMLVGLLGKKEEALNGNWDMPFTDVDNWAKPFVGYAYANGLTSGTSATTFGGNDLVSASQYLTFVLKVLGHETGKDFQWDKAWELSDKIGLTDGRYNADTKVFTRGDVAIISCNALSVNQKGTAISLGQVLEEEKQGNYRAWYEVDDSGNLYIKTNIDSQNWDGYSMLIINHMINRNNPNHYECGINYGQNIAAFAMGSQLSYAWSDEVSGVKSTDIYVFKGTASLDRFWDLKKEYNTPHDAVSALPEEFIYHTTLNNQISFKSTYSPLIFTDFKITYDTAKQQETYTAVIKPEISNIGKYSLTYKRERGNQNAAMSYIDKGDGILIFTREMNHFADAGSGASGTFYISYVVYSMGADGTITCTKAKSNGIHHIFE